MKKRLISLFISGFAMFGAISCGYTSESGSKKPITEVDTPIKKPSDDTQTPPETSPTPEPKPMDGDLKTGEVDNLVLPKINNPLNNSIYSYNNLAKYNDIFDKSTKNLKDEYKQAIKFLDDYLKSSNELLGINVSEEELYIRFNNAFTSLVDKKERGYQVNNKLFDEYPLVLEASLNELIEEYKNNPKLSAEFKEYLDDLDLKELVTSIKLNEEAKAKLLLTHEFYGSDFWKGNQHKYYNGVQEYIGELWFVRVNGPKPPFIYEVLKSSVKEALDKEVLKNFKPKTTTSSGRRISSLFI
ncbi:hypothetical protein RRG55_01400 [Mycoplasmopsis felis]|uniref:hypothetical protein n=1 Tax=Mycoplasmopsis felis TaxID=33923 RepID=UPI002AFEA78A|nr:hypothetical protein [Mycoplasmopsis felis]WQQ03666.1 hypothetical protein RRG47_02380 [Mycoplasmopsis felis]